MVATAGSRGGKSKTKTRVAEAHEVARLTAPSIQSVQAVYEALRESVERVDGDSRAVLEALQFMGDTLDVAKGSANLGAGLGGLALLGPMALPIPLAVRAVMSPVSKYVQQRTGISLSGWMEFVGSTQKQFEEYLALLKRVAALAAADAAATADSSASPTAEKGAAGGALTVGSGGTRLNGGEALLREAKTKTQIWRPILAQFAQLGHAMDALVEGWRAEGGRSDPASTKPGSGGDGWAQNLGGLFQGAAAKVTDQLASARQLGGTYLLSTFIDLRERVTEFREQVDHLSESLDDLEDLLDLEIAQLRARAGELSAEELDLLGRRVAAAVLVPRLAQQLAASRARRELLQTRLRLLDEASQRGAIGDRARAALTAEYGGGLAETAARLDALSAEAALWQEHGGPMLEMATAWLLEQEDLVRAKQLVGELQEGEARTRIDGLQRELLKVREARKALDALRQPPAVGAQGTLAPA